ncbi:MucR family transcriptional regulator [Methylobacterium oxalidis]|uniref:Transcriptional regulator n=1 Tax=Methylobacterium oxalidis TaxID=944322 RepID=A0A512JAB4_9HYPH|nr:MucR family transcriptional regulator [Methylobacterium oxalidis]GEP06839.1 transcriptional regulator [Methylobacterium oxalidis]GJE35026.1 Transcriptional regulatory protein ros [Methylobacterium oxalidis]GLS67557.1 transcriptional regulator [Methylobacterium oxalidis]
MSETTTTDPVLVDLTVGIVSAFVANNPVPVADLPKVIEAVHTSLSRLGAPQAAETAPEVAKPTPAEIKRSVKPDTLISFIDGKPYKLLKRHLKKNGLDPASYRARYGLPADYPMVAPSYAAQRSELAKASGLGVSGGRQPVPQAAE